MKSSLCFTYCTLLIVSFVSSGLLFILVASEASKPLSQHKEQHLPSVHREHEPPEESTEGITTNKPLSEANLPRSRERSSQVASEFDGIFRSDDDESVVRHVKSKHGVGRVSRRKSSWKKDVFVERPVRLESPPDLNEAIFCRRFLPTRHHKQRMYMVNVYLLLFIVIEWYLSMRLFDALHERAKKMKKLSVLLTFCWVLLVSQILAISSLYNDGLQDIPGTPSVITLMEHQSSELNIESKFEENIEATLKNISLPLADDPISTEEPEPQEAHDIPQQKISKDAPSVVMDSRVASPVEAKPAVPPEDKINDSGGGGGESPKQEVVDAVPPEREDGKNMTGETPSSSDGNLTEENPMPVFSEWAQKQMAEAEKKHGENVNASAMKRNSKPAGGKMPPLKLRAKNYASPDCGAKIIASNPEAQSTGSVLTSHKDEYLLNPCTSKIWFVVELCEPIQAERVELANFELFSSSPKEFSISISNRFPTREWSNVGQFTADDERTVQSFKLHPHLFGKFVRVEVLSHYNSEHFCPVSLFHVYGTSEFEAFETDNTPLGDDGDDDDELTILDIDMGKENSVAGKNHDQKVDPKEGGAQIVKNPNNILKSAGEAVMNIVKKAAEVLVKTNEKNGLGNGTTETAIGDDAHQDVSNENKLDLIIDSDKTSSIDVTLCPPSRCSLYCFTLAYRPLCVNCPQELRERLERTMNCKHNLLTSLLRSVPIGASFNESQHLLCANILGTNLTERREEMDLKFGRSIMSWLPDEFLAGFCNMRAYDEGLIKAMTHGERESSEASVDKPNPQITASTDTTTTDHQGEATENEGTNPAAHPSSSAEEDDRSKPAVVPQEDINIFNVQEEVSTPTSIEQFEESGSVSPAPPTDVSKENKDETHENVPEGTLSPSLEEIDKLLLEQQLDGLGGGGNPPVATSTTGSMASSSSPGPNQKVQPESVFLRLSNRIKALERNMSLSGQYLEELSRRYRKQVEELQNSYSKTLHDMEEQNRRILDSEAMLRDENDRLRKEFVVFRESILSWRNVIIILGGLLFGQTVLICAIVRGCKASAPEVETDNTIHNELEKVESVKPAKGMWLRRKSVDGIIGEMQASGKLKKRRPSEEALNISGTYMNLLIEEDRSGNEGVKVERKRTKHKHRKISAPAMMQHHAEEKVKRTVSVEPPASVKVVKVDLVRTESAPEPKRQISEAPQEENNRIDELPLLEDNDEFIIPAASDLSYNEFIPDVTSENNRTNGTVSSSSSVDSKSTNRSGKGRRLSSPAFFKNSIMRASMSRKSSGKKSTASQNVSSASSNTSSSSSSGNNNVSTSINVHSTSAVGNHSEEGPPLLATIDNNSSTPSITNNGWDGWRVFKKSSSQDKFNKRKSKSESPDVEIVVRNGSVNGSLSDHVPLDVKPKRGDHKGELKSSVSFNGSTTSSEKKLGGSGGSFRRLFRKVF
ncbi:uncharacterized protein LOC129773200 [Toxorhynchites rutilus septentrionalis]|uniref:uncharacterized protein LOC129773200 n=1 Tax=Toxorhynchites rutilus septentrionalis TaxID=329112 RepID=UPI00247AC290|nr:uncharacterized protein LOC129773200 [Toxorhynchites rutilus septentrionalis]